MKAMMKASATLRSLIMEGSMPVPFTSCRMWIRGYSGVGYGYVWVPSERKMISAPRVSFIAWNGELGPDEVPRHTCDWMPCVNHEHLIRGTREMNMHDMKVRGRARRRLHPIEVIDIRKRDARGESHYDIAAVYGVTRQAIDQIVNRVTWTHIE